jgi:hypothetical protein
MTKAEWLASRCGDSFKATQAEGNKSGFRLADHTLQVAITLAGFAGHDDDCLFNRISDSVVPGSCSCGYSDASRALRDLME